MKRISLLVGLCFVTILGVFVGFRKSSPPVQITTPPTIAPSPTPFPFQELTIPFLRKRTYTSQLGPLEKSYETSGYTAYITSYQSDGLKIQALLTQPKGTMSEGGWPAIIFIHGYIPPTQYRTTQNYYDYVDYLARNGFVVFKIDLRGHGTSEGEPSGAYYSGDYIIDTLNAYNALAGSSFINAKKIGLWGHSMAGNVVMRSAVVQRDIPAVVIWGGAVYTYQDMLTYGIQDGSYVPPPSTSDRQRTRQRLRDTYGNFDASVPFWQQLAVTNYLNELQGAVQLNHAVNDTVVNVGYSRDLNALLDKTSVIHELNEYQSGGHNISGSAFTQAMQNTVRFYKEYLNR